MAILTGGLALLVPATTEQSIANGDTRTIHLHHAHTKESIDATYLVDGRYDSQVLEKLNWFLRDWRRDEPTHMDPRLFDVIWDVYRESGSGQPIEVMSAYRSPETNAMLRRRSRAVAEHSQHILGKAMDQHYVDVPISRIREIAMKLQRGGVGFYPTAGSPFVHMDVGGVRHWPRMSYDQLARLFPDGKTVHIPSNGQPLPGYEEARAELEARGDSFAYPTATEVKSKGFFAWLFGGEEEEDAAAAARTPARGRQRVASLDPATSGAAPVPMADVGVGRDAGARDFFRTSSIPTRTAAPVQAAARPAQALAPPIPAPPPQAPVVVADEPSPQARQVLARAMAPAREPAAVAAETALPPRAAPVAALPPAPAPLAQATRALEGDEATMAPSAPLPPRRPTELASSGPAAPLPPSRPTELASLAPGRTPDLKTGKPDGLSRLIGGSVAGRTVELPAAITQGAVLGRSAAPPPQVLAYAAPGTIPAPPARPYVPLPVARPQFVAARLDRSNFRSLTGSAATTRTTVRSALGSSMTALRPAAQSSLGELAAQASSGVVQGFGSKATDLSAERFAGPAVKPLERVVTSATASPVKLRSSTE